MKKMLFIIGCVFLFSGCATTDSAVSTVTETTEAVVPAVENVVQDVINTQMSDNVPTHNRYQKRDYHRHHHDHHHHHKHSGKKASFYRKVLIKKTKIKIKPKHHKLKKH